MLARNVTHGSVSVQGIYPGMAFGYSARLTTSRNILAQAYTLSRVHGDKALSPMYKARQVSCSIDYVLTCNRRHHLVILYGKNNQAPLLPACSNNLYWATAAFEKLKPANNIRGSWLERIRRYEIKKERREIEAWASQAAITLHTLLPHTATHLRNLTITKDRAALPPKNCRILPTCYQWQGSLNKRITDMLENIFSMAVQEHNVPGKSKKKPSSDHQRCVLLVER